jgi:class 3 adenylate cyclase/tetratricopeptide (TPR) repeat protein
MATCATCGQENPDGFRFCGHCGAELVPTAARREERKVLTVLYADVVGSTARADGVDPEDVRAVLAPFHARVRAELERYGGTVEKFIGDAVVALFGAPVVHEDDAERAVRAALVVHDAIAELNEAQPGLELQVRVGIATGEALVALDADPRSGEGVAAGDVMNTGARLQAAAPPGGVLVGETTYRATRHVIDYEPMAPVAAKGKAEPLLAWRALEPRSRLGIDVRQHGAAPLVGRRRELDVVLGALERARAERETQLVTLVGVPGIGKSRLVWETLQTIEAEPELTFWRQGRCLPYGDGVTFWAVGEMVKAHAGILDSDSSLEAEQKLRQVVDELLGAEAPLLMPHLRPLVGLAGDRDASRQQAAEAFAAWRRFFEAVADQRPLVLVFEDLHWADDGLLDFVDHLADWARGVSLLLICTARPELLERRLHWSGGKLNAATVALAPLSEDETGELVAALATGRIDAEARAAVLARAAGNPLYAEQFVRMVADRGDDAAALPETVQGIIAARLDLLPSEEKELLQRAAVVGKVFWSGAIAALGGASEGDVELSLHGLERKELVRRERRSSVGGENEYAFRHALLRDVAYGQIRRAQRAELHRRAALWIETLGRAEDLADLRAHHWLNAVDYARQAGLDASEVERRARGALIEAADRARALNAIAAACRFYEQALELWPGQDVERDLLAVRSLAAGLLLSREIDREQVTALAARLVTAGRPAEAAVAEVVLMFDAVNDTDLEQSKESRRRSMQLIEGLPPSPEMAFVLAYAGRDLIAKVELEAAIDVARRLLVVAEALGHIEGAISALTTIGSCTAMLGGETTELEAAIERAAVVRSPEYSRGLKNLASILVGRGELDRGVETHELAVEESDRLGSAWEVSWSLAELGYCRYLQGRWDEALAHVDSVMRPIEGGATHYLEPLARSVRAAISLARDEVTGALEDSERAAEMALGIEDQLVPATLAPRLGVLVDAGRRDEAWATAEELFARDPDRLILWEARAWVALEELELLDRLVAVGAPPGPSRWYEAGTAYAEGRYTDAADTLAAIGARTDEARARLRAGRQLLEHGRAGEAETQVERALAFWRSVGATRYVRDAEALLQTA